MKKRKSSNANYNTIKALIGIISLVVVFLLVSYLVNKNLDFLKENISSGYLSMIIYFILISLEVVVAPTSLIPIIPLATALWGSSTSFLLTLFGWTFGSVIAFLITRKIGVPLLEKITSIEEMNKYQRFVPDKNLFLGVVTIRIFIPFDVMSYVIAFFTKIDLKKYTLATFIGFIPSTFFLAYFGQIQTNILYTLVLIGILIILVLIFFSKQLNNLFNRVFKN